MDVQQTQDGHLHFRLGPVERWIIAIGATLLIGIVGWTANSFAERLDRLENLLGAAATQQAVTSSQLMTLSAQLADVPSLATRVSQLEVRQQADAEAIKELRATRGLR